MNLKEIKRIIRGRIPSLAALVFMIIGVINLISLANKTAFYDLLIQIGGGYKLIFRHMFDVPMTLLMFIPALLLSAAIILNFIHITAGKRILLISALACSVLSALVLILLPSEITQRMFVFEFMSYRYSFMHKILFETSASFDIFIKTLKFLPYLISVIFISVGIVREKDNIV